jgi:hypothetical protein
MGGILLPQAGDIHAPTSSPVRAALIFTPIPRLLAPPPAARSFARRGEAISRRGPSSSPIPILHARGRGFRLNLQAKEVSPDPSRTGARPDVEVISLLLHIRFFARLYEGWSPEAVAARSQRALAILTTSHVTHPTSHISAGVRRSEGGGRGGRPVASEEPEAGFLLDGCGASFGGNFRSWRTPP